MENEPINNSVKRPFWQWVLLYILIAIGIYGFISFFFTGRNVGKNDQVNSQASSSANSLASNSKVLDMSNLGLQSIPETVFNQTNLEELNVSRNNLTGAIQSQIGQLKNLKVLNASYNQMTGVPAEIGQLTNLEILDLSNNKLTGLPNELGNLINLKTLNLVGNKYSEQDLNGIKAKLPNTNFILK